MNDDLRPRGAVQMPCAAHGCGWHFWVDALDERLPDGPFMCEAHETDPARKLALAEAKAPQ